MIRSAVTVSLVAEARGGPFVFWDGLADACRHASELGFDAIEIFAPGPEALLAPELKSLLSDHKLKVAAVGTGAGMVKHGLSLIETDPARRQSAYEFVRSMIDAGATLDAPAIIGSMQGRWHADLPKLAALESLAAALDELSSHAALCGQPLIYEPLNRYETNLINTMADGSAFLKSFDLVNVKLLADLFHMNIEESDVPAAIRQNAKVIGHIHYVDSNRSAAGYGHSDFHAIAEAIKSSGYDGYLSAEAFALPDSLHAAQATIASIRQHFTS